jgi:hypothetical protein
MSHREEYTLSPASAEQFWSARMNALERHLSAKTWALAAFTMVLSAYPIVRIAIPAILHAIVPVVTRAALNLIVRY